MIKSQNKPIFITGVPRSGTTWIANILGSAKGVRLLSEPDNEKYSFIGRIWKKSLHRFPYGNLEGDSEVITNLYSVIFKGRFPKNRSWINHFLNYIFQYDSTKNETLVKEKESELVHSLFPELAPKLLTLFLYYLTMDGWKPNNRLLIKSVHSGLCLPVIQHQFNPIMVLVFRHPGNIISSCLDLRIDDANRDIFNRSELKGFLKEYENEINQLNDPLSFMGLQIGIFYTLWETELKNQQNLITTSHEDLCEDTVEKYHSFFNRLNLDWTQSIQDFILKMNQPGDGFKTYRVAKDLKNKWKKKLNRDQIMKIQKGYSILPVKHYEEFKI